MWEILMYLESVLNASSLAYVCLSVTISFNKISRWWHRRMSHHNVTSTMTSNHNLWIWSWSKVFAQSSFPWALPTQCPNGHSTIPGTPLVLPRGSHTPSPFLATFPSWICSCPWASTASSPALLRVVSEPRTDRNGHRGPKHPQNTALVYKPEAFTCCFEVVWAKLKTPVALSYWWRAAYFQ